MTKTVEAGLSGGRAWATSSLVAGVVWVALAISPTIFTTLLGLPFAGYALVVGWLSRRDSLRVGDRSGARRAGWGVGLGCAGFVYVIVANLIVGGLILAALFTVVRPLLQGTPIP
jgi:hypothetical protein